MPSGMPTEATVAHVLVSKYADHLPLYRQAQIYSRQGIDLDRSTLTAWVGAAWVGDCADLHPRAAGETAETLECGRPGAGGLGTFAGADRGELGERMVGLSHATRREMLLS